MRLFFLFFFFFVFSSSSCRGASYVGAATSNIVPPAPSPSSSPSPSPSPSPAGAVTVTVEEACHLMVASNESNRPLYPFCVAALRSLPVDQTRNATIYRLAVLAAELVQRDVAAAVGRMLEMQSRGGGAGGGEDDPELDKCLYNFAQFIPLLEDFIIGPLRQGGYVGMQKDLRFGMDYADCRWMNKRNPVEEQQEILALLQALYAICIKYCSDGKSEADNCSF